MMSVGTASGTDPQCHIYDELSLTRRRFALQMNIRILSFFLCAWISSIVAADQLLSPLEPADAETSAGWVKHDGNPVLGGQYGTCFDISVLKEGDKYRMWVSWRPKASIALTESSEFFLKNATRRRTPKYGLC